MGERDDWVDLLIRFTIAVIVLGAAYGIAAMVIKIGDLQHRVGQLEQKVKQ